MEGSEFVWPDPECPRCNGPVNAQGLCVVPECVVEQLKVVRMVEHYELDKHQDNLQRRRYAEAALTGILAAVLGETATHTVIATKAFKIADAMFAEQKRRESAESAS